ncbi:MAG: hypothetical protein QOF98_58 [Streptomyces sp.]|nr:hypothetical protein [Streptomyces sp.]
MTGRVQGPLHRGAKLGLYWSIVAALIVVPIGIALGSPLIPLLSILAIMLACVLGTWLVSVGDSGRTTVLVASWCLGLALALALIGFGIWTIYDFSPSCRSTPQFVCFDTPAEQRTKAMVDSLLYPISGGTVLLLVLASPAVRYVRRRRRAYVRSAAGRRP